MNIHPGNTKGQIVRDLEIDPREKMGSFAIISELRMHKGYPMYSFWRFIEYKLSFLNY